MSEQKHAKPHAGQRKSHKRKGGAGDLREHDKEQEMGMIRQEEEKVRANT